MIALAPGAKAQTLTVSLNTHAVNFALTGGSATNPGSNAVVINHNLEPESAAAGT